MPAPESAPLPAPELVPIPAPELVLAPETDAGSPVYLDPDLENVKDMIQEGLETLIAPAPRGKGFPFDLPAVEWIVKVHLAHGFLEELDRTGIPSDLLKDLQPGLEKLRNVLSTCITTETLALVRKIRTSAGEFARLRQIFGDKDATGKQIKQRIKRYEKHLKKQLPAHPEYSEILNRLDKYAKGLYHGYDDPKIPLTNLDLERYFNAEKRFYRRRTGLKNRANQFVIESEEVLLGAHYRHEAVDGDTSFDMFMDTFKKKRLLLGNSEITDSFKKSQARKKELRRKYLWKPSIKKVATIYHGLKNKLRKISSGAT